MICYLQPSPCLPLTLSMIPLNPLLPKVWEASLPLKPELESHLEYYCPGCLRLPARLPSIGQQASPPAQQKYLTPHPLPASEKSKGAPAIQSFVAPTASPVPSSDEHKLLLKINIRPCVCGGLRQKQGPSIVLCEYRQKHERPSSHRNERTSLRLVNISDAAFGQIASLVLPSPPS